MVDYAVSVSLGGISPGTGEYLVTAYGATGDGVTNDTVAVQAANNAAGGGEIYFPGGTYVLDGITTARGRWVLANDAILLHKANSAAAYPLGDNYMLRGSEDLTIVGGTLDGNKDNQTNRTTLVGFYGDNLHVSGCNIRNTVQEGFRIHDADNVSIHDNNFSDIGEHGSVLNEDAMAVHIYNFNASGVTRAHIKDNFFINSAPSGIDVAPVAIAITAAVGRVSEAVISGNTVIGFGTSFASNYQAAIEVYKNCDRVIIANNVIYDAYSHGIRVNDSNDVMVTGNTVYMRADAAVDLACISVQARSHGTVTCSQMQVTGNIVGSTLGRGIYVAGGGASYLLVGANISDNIVTISGSKGIQFQYMGGSIIADNNLVQNCATNGYDISTSSGSMTISGGNVDSATEAAIYARTSVSGLEMTIDGVSISNSGDLGISCYSDTLNVLNCIDDGSPRVLDTTTTTGVVANCSWQGVYEAMPAGGTVAVGDYGKTVTNAGATAGDGVTLPAVSTIPVGFWVKVIIVAAQRFDVIPNAVDRIFPTCAADGYRLRNTGTIGESVTLEHTHADGWSIVAISGTWTDFGS